MIEWRQSFCAALIEENIQNSCPGLSEEAAVYFINSGGDEEFQPNERASALYNYEQFGPHD